MGTIIDKVMHLANVKDDLEAAFIEQGQNPTDVIATYPDIVRNMETSIDGESVIKELNEQTATADELVAIAKRKYFETLNTGIYVWKKLTAEGGDFIEYVVSGESTTYPDGGEQDGYWYELFDPATLIPNNIREGVDIFGVTGTLVEGTEYGVFVNAYDSDNYPTDMKIVMPSIAQAAFGTTLDIAVGFFYRVVNVEIITNDIGRTAFRSILSSNTQKCKIKAASIQDTAFYQLQAKKIWISKKCTDIEGYAFQDSYSALTIYCEASSQPTGYLANWNAINNGNATVKWGITEAAFDAL